MDIDGIKVTVKGDPYPGEIEGYVRRITGYLVGTTDRFNNAKQAEEQDRVKHSATIDAVLYEELKARVSERVDVSPGPDSIRPEKWA